MPTQTLFDLLTKPGTGDLAWDLILNTNFDNIDKFFGLKGLGDPNTNSSGGPQVGIFLGQRYLQEDGEDISGILSRVWLCTTTGTGGAGGTAVWTKLSEWIALEMGRQQSVTWEKSQSGLWVNASAFITPPNILELDTSVSNFFYLTLTGDLDIEDPVNAFVANQAAAWILELEQGAGLYEITFVGDDYIFQNDIPLEATPVDGYIDSFQFLRRRDGLIEVSAILGYTPVI